jgi:5-methylcytosine-specific restriction endonuclease McrA
MSEALLPVHDKEAAWAAFEAFRESGWKNRTIPIGVRLSVFEAANWRCCYCGVRLLYARESQALFANEARIPRQDWRTIKSREATLEHILKRADGGGDERANLAAACAWCNHSRGDWDAEVWFEQVMWLKKWGRHPHFKKVTAP